MIVVAAGSVLTDLSKAATGSLVAAVWQGILLAGAAAVGLKLLPKIPAAVRFAIWFGVFLLVTGLPFVALWPPHSASIATSGSGHGAWLVLDERWCIAIAAVWAVASLIRAFTLVVAAFRVRALWKRATPTQEYANRTLETRGAHVCWSDEVDRPTVIGFLAPKILIPRWLLEKLTPAELEQVVLHEAGHLGRADDWMNLIQKIALVVFPLNPVLAWVERRLCFERELAVDEHVLQAFAGRSGAAKAYAECLANLAEYRIERRGFALGLVIGLLGRESELGKRIIRLLDHREPMKPAQARLLIGGAMVLLLTAATGFEHCPQLVGFSGQKAIGIARRADLVSANGLIGSRTAYKAIPVRATLPPPPQWKTVGDASPHISRPGKLKTLQRVIRPMHEDMATDVASTQPEVSQPYGVVETVSAQQVLGDGQIVITRFVAVTSVGQQKTRAVQTIARPQTDFQVSPEGSVHPYAAVPVQGGWLVFQL